VSVDCHVTWLKETCQSLCRLIVIAADNNTKQLVQLSLGDDQQRCLVMSIIEMLLVSPPSCILVSPPSCILVSPPSCILVSPPCCILIWCVCISFRVMLRHIRLLESGFGFTLNLVSDSVKKCAILCESKSGFYNWIRP